MYSDGLEPAKAQFTEAYSGEGEPAPLAKSSQDPVQCDDERGEAGKESGGAVT